MKFKMILVTILFSLFMTGISQATILTFDTDALTPEVTLGGYMRFNDIGGGHLYCGNYTGLSAIKFENLDTYVNDFHMNALPWEGYSENPDIAQMDIEAKDALGHIIWSGSIDLANYRNWDDWFTVSIETANVAHLFFHARNAPFNPSIDNLRINESFDTAPVPEPATMLLLGTGLLGLSGVARKKLKK